MGINDVVLLSECGCRSLGVFLHCILAGVIPLNFRERIDRSMCMVFHCRDISLDECRVQAVFAYSRS